jgi:hypothetical protein
MRRGLQTETRKWPWPGCWANWPLVDRDEDSSYTATRCLRLRAPSAAAGRRGHQRALVIDSAGVRAEARRSLSVRRKDGRVTVQCGC